MIHLDHLYRVAFHLAQDPVDAEDLVQETFVRALAAHEQFDPGTNMKAWLTKILHNFFVDHYRQRKRWISAEAVTHPESEHWQRLPDLNPGPDSNVLRKELDDQITQALKKIPEEFRAPMPTVLRDGPYAFVFFSSDRTELAHIHVKRDRQILKAWLDRLNLPKIVASRNTKSMTSCDW